MSRTQMTITYSDGRHEVEYIDREELGIFGSLFRLRREARLREAKTQRESRLVKLNRDIEALEAWHHAWCLEWDVDYRELHPGEWCERHRKTMKSCFCTSAEGRYQRAMLTEMGYEIRRGDGSIVRCRPAQRTTSTLTVEDRRAATRTMAKWGSEG